MGTNNVINIISKLQDTMLKKYSNGLESTFAIGFGNQYKTPDDDDDDKNIIDVPRTADRPYTTHRPFILPKTKSKQGIFAFKEGEVLPEEEEEIVKPEDEEEVTTEPDLGGESEVGMGDVGSGDTGMGDFGGIGQEEEPKTSTEIGRIYELKKIYTRLTALESYLSNEGDSELLKLRHTISKSIELFEVLSSNFDSYKNKLDDIIIMYYKFLKESYNMVKKHYAKQSNK